MKKLIIINWKWLPIPALEAEDEWDEPSDHIRLIEVEGTENKLIQVNLHREEAEFDDEYEELYEPRNQLLQSLVSQYIEDYEVVFFLHKNAPHHYSEYDLTWFQEYVPKLKVVLFGGGEDFIYDLHNSTSGMLDQVGNFSLKALNKDEKLQESYFDGIWKHYQSADQLTDITYSIIHKLITETLPVFETPKSESNLVEWAQEIMLQPSELPPAVLVELQQLAQGHQPNIANIRTLLK